MRPFTYDRPSSFEDAAGLSREAARNPDRAEAANLAAIQYLAGGTTLLDLMKLDVMRPDRLIDIGSMKDDSVSQIEADDSGLRIGALVRMSQAADDKTVRQTYPAIAQSLMLAASAQLRNMASLGGNLLQRTRCSYFRDTSWSACNKRDPGSGCAALGGNNRLHAVLGTSSACIASYPGDFAQALIAFGAHVETIGPNGGRRIALSDLHRKPEDRPDIETILEPGELIRTIVVPAAPYTQRSLYLKIRDRESYEFAVTSAAVGLDLDGNTVREARIALGGVATTPWRSHEAEQALAGKTLDEKSATDAAEIAFRDARAQRDNAFKIPLGKQTLVRALLEVKTMEIRG